MLADAILVCMPSLACCRHLLHAFTRPASLIRPAARHEDILSLLCAAAWHPQLRSAQAESADRMCCTIFLALRLYFCCVIAASFQACSEQLMVRDCILHNIRIWDDLVLLIDSTLWNHV